MKTQSSVTNMVALHSGSTIQPTSTSTSADPNGVDLFDQLQNILIGDSDESTKEAAKKLIDAIDWPASVLSNERMRAEQTADVSSNNMFLSSLYSVSLSRNSPSPPPSDDEDDSTEKEHPSKSHRPRHHYRYYKKKKKKKKKTPRRDTPSVDDDANFEAAISQFSDINKSADIPTNVHSHESSKVNTTTITTTTKSSVPTVSTDSYDLPVVTSTEEPKVATDIPTSNISPSNFVHPRPQPGWVAWGAHKRSEQV